MAASRSLDPLIAHIERQCGAAHGGSLLHTRFQYDLDNPAKPGEKKRRHSTDGESSATVVPKADSTESVVLSEVATNTNASKF